MALPRFKLGPRHPNAAPGGWNPPVLLPGAVWKELWMRPALCDLWTPSSPWGAQRCLGERDRCRVSFRRRAAAQSPLRAVRDASYFRRTRPKLSVHVSARRPHSALDSPKTQFLGITLGMLRTSPFWGGKKPVTLRPADVCQSVCNVF